MPFKPIGRHRPSSFTTSINSWSAVDWGRAEPAELPHVFAVSGKYEYPKIFLFGNGLLPEKEMLLFGSGRNAFNLIVAKQKELLSTARPPAVFQTIPCIGLSTSTVFKGIRVSGFQEEIRLYQELLIHMASDGQLDPNQVGPKFDKIVKLAALASSPERHEAELARQRAIEVAERLLRKEEV